MTVRMKITRSKTGKRRSSHKTKMPTLTNAGDEVTLRHRATKTGLYRGRKAFEVKPPKPKKEESVENTEEKRTEETVDINTKIEDTAK